jgi:hypothetical protein
MNTRPEGRAHYTTLAQVRTQRRPAAPASMTGRGSIVRIINPLALVALAQRRRAIAWLLGLRNFSLLGPGAGGAIGGAGMPGAGSPPRPVAPPPDPVRRLKVRMATTLGGILTLLLTLLMFLVAGIASAAGAARPTGWILAVGGGIVVLLAAWAAIRSMTSRMPTPGVLVITLALDVLALAGGVAILFK